MLLRFVVKHHIFFKAAPHDDSILAQKILPTVNQASDEVTNSEHKRSIYILCVIYRLGCFIDSRWNQKIQRSIYRKVDSEMAGLLLLTIFWKAMQFLLRLIDLPGSFVILAPH